MQQGIIYVYHMYCFSRLFTGVNHALDAGDTSPDILVGGDVNGNIPNVILVMIFQLKLSYSFDFLVIVIVLVSGFFHYSYR